MIPLAMALLLVGTGLGHPSPVRTISARELTVTVPPRGIGVGASAMMADGTDLSLRVEHAASGSIAVATERVGHDAGGVPITPAGGLVRPCADRAFRLTGQHWTQTFHWSFRGSSTPASLPRSQARDALRRAASNITGAHNNCGRPDHVSAEHRFDGTTRLRPNITATGCDNAGRDGVNVVGFRDLPPGVVGLTCWWWVVGSPVTIEADMALNKGKFRWRTDRAGCTGEYLVEAVATHEFGHVFGLGHVREARHPMLTMSESGFACDNSPSTLGLGDMRGLEQIY
jgi:hypothetical protein